VDNEDEDAAAGDAGVIDEKTEIEISTE